MSFWKYIAVSVWHYRRIHFATAWGVAAAAAVITGALLVGDSMRGSLRALVLGRLGRIDSLLLAEHPFRIELVDALAADPAFREHFTSATPLVLTRGAATASANRTTRRAAGLSILGCRDDFWALGRPPEAERTEDSPSSPLAEGVAISRTVADELAVDVGDAIVIRVGITSAIPADSTLGEKDDAVALGRFTVGAILAEDHPLASFTIAPSQQASRNLFVPLKRLQRLLEMEGRANGAAIATLESGTASSRAAQDALRTALRPELADFGVTVGELPRQSDVVQIEAERLVLAPHLVDVVKQVAAGRSVQPAVSYLANTIAVGDRRAPYSIVTGIESAAEMGPLLDVAGDPIVLGDAGVAVNDWTAEKLSARVGDEVVLRYYEPETTHGELREHDPPLTLRLQAIVPLERGGRPTLAADEKLTPSLPGVTDQESINNWELPFELVEPISDDDETYWDDYRTTPKAFVPLALAKRLWPTRWGTVSLLRVRLNSGETPEDFARRVAAALDPTKLGMTVALVKRDGLRAAAGSTPFDGLFFGFSSFLFAAAVMLVALLFRLGAEQRTNELGLLTALGTPSRRVRRLLLTEAGAVACDGAGAGVALGIGYAWLMIYGLNHWWVEATVAPFLKLHVTVRSLVLGFALAVVVAVLAMRWVLRRLERMPVRALVAGNAEIPATGKSRGLIVPGVCFTSAVALSLAAWKLEGETQAGAFFGAGALTLGGMLSLLLHQLGKTSYQSPVGLNLTGLTIRNMRRNPGRTVLTVGLAAAATFLIVALSAFRLQPADDGVGGFDLIAQADLPLHGDLNDVEDRRGYGFDRAAETVWGNASAVAFRVRDGDDASCLNLFQSRRPRILGVPSGSLETSRFAFAVAAGDEPWRLLADDRGVDDAGRAIVPMILDRNTAYYGLKIYGVGNRLVVQDALDRPVTLEVVGLLSNSVLQGDLLIAEENFLKLYPETAGSRFLLVDADDSDPPSIDQLAAALESQLEDYGVDATDARWQLAQYLAVQNTYLSTFQSLGLLGLLLGVVGLGAVQLRGVFERRGELALMQAQGFRPRRLARMVLGENLALLLTGLGIGCVAALVAVMPHAVVNRASPPWVTLSLLVAAVAVVGVASGWQAVRATLRAPLTPALRGE